MAQGEAAGAPQHSDDGEPAADQQPGPRRRVQQAQQGQERVGVLLLNLGGPETLDDVQPFLYNLFADDSIIRLPTYGGASQICIGTHGSKPTWAGSDCVISLAGAGV